MHKFSNLEEFLKATDDIAKNKEQAVAIKMWYIAKEFKLTREEFISKLKELGYKVAVNKDEVLFTKDKELMQAALEGANYLRITNVKFL
jgi:tryptophan synthase alpha subunit